VSKSDDKESLDPHVQGFLKPGEKREGGGTTFRWGTKKTGGRKLLTKGGKEKNRQTPVPGNQNAQDWGQGKVKNGRVEISYREGKKEGKRDGTEKRTKSGKKGKRRTNQGPAVNRAVSKKRQRKRKRERGGIIKGEKGDEHPTRHCEDKNQCWGKKRGKAGEARKKKPSSAAEKKRGS